MINHNKTTRRARVYSCKLNRRKISNLMSYIPGIDPKGKSNFIPSSDFGLVLKNIKYIALSNGDKVVVCFKGSKFIPKNVKTSNNKLFLKAHSPKPKFFFDPSKMSLESLHGFDADAQTS